MQIQLSNIEDIDFAFKLYRTAVDYQRINGHNLWPEFERDLIEREIKEKHHYKIIDGEHIACVFSVVYNDPIIWDEKDKEPSIYLHRIAVNPSFKGKGIMHLIKKWAADHGHATGKNSSAWTPGETMKN